MTSLILGTFDGVHIAHRELLKRSHGDKKIVCTFSTHPMLFFNKDIKLLTLAPEKEYWLKKYGASEVYTSVFDEAFSRLTAEEYLAFLCKKFSPDEITVGYNHTFGNKGEGNFKTVCELSGKYHYSPNMVLPVKSSGRLVSSTAVRESLESGDLLNANAMLGRSYAVSGTVIHGKHIGASIGFPTVNLKTDPVKLLPQNGTYCVHAYVSGKKHKGITNIGTNPTVTDDTETKIETHILGFDEDIYGSTVTLEFEKKLRDEKRFGSLEELKNQLARDAALADLFLVD